MYGLQGAIAGAIGWMLVLTLVMIASPLPAWAASSAAIRAYDDVEVTSKTYAGQNLFKAEFANAKLSGADFSGANLQGAVFNGAIASKAKFRGADFSNGIAYLSDFTDADFSQAILTEAMLLKSNFRGATITGADFTDASLDREQILYLCQSASGVNLTTGVATRESLGCR